MASPKTIRNKEYANRKARFMRRFHNAAKTLDHIPYHKMLSAVPKDPVSIEALQQYFMASALNEKGRMPHILDQLHAHLGHAKSQRLSMGFLDAVFYTDKKNLEPISAPV